MEAAAPASAGSFREESAALGWEWGGVGGRLTLRAAPGRGRGAGPGRGSRDLTVSLPSQCQRSSASAWLRAEESSSSSKCQGGLQWPTGSFSPNPA